MHAAPAPRSCQRPPGGASSEACPTFWPIDRSRCRRRTSTPPATRGVHPACLLPPPLLLIVVERWGAPGPPLGAPLVAPPGRAHARAACSCRSTACRHAPPVAHFQPHVAYSDLVNMSAKEYRQRALAEMAQVGSGWRGRAEQLGPAGTAAGTAKGRGAPAACGPPGRPWLVHATAPQILSFLTPALPFPPPAVQVFLPAGHCCQRR